MKARYKTWFLLTIFCVSAALATDDATEVLAKAQTYYKAGKFDSTVVVLRNYLKTRGNDNSSQELVPLLMEALVRKGDFEFSRRLFQCMKKNSRAPRLCPGFGVSKGCA